MHRYTSYLGGAVTALPTERNTAKMVKTPPLVRKSNKASMTCSSRQQRNVTKKSKSIPEPAIYAPNAVHPSIALSKAQPERFNVLDAWEELERSESRHIKYVTKSEILLKEQARIIKRLSQDLEQATNELITQKHSENSETNLRRQIVRLQDALSTARTQARNENEELQRAVGVLTTEMKRQNATHTEAMAEKDRQIAAMKYTYEHVVEQRNTSISDLHIQISESQIEVDTWVRHADSEFSKQGARLVLAEAQTASCREQSQKTQADNQRLLKEQKRMRRDIKRMRENLEQPESSKLSQSSNCSEERSIEKSDCLVADDHHYGVEDDSVAGQKGRGKASTGASYHPSTKSLEEELSAARPQTTVSNSEPPSSIQSDVGIGSRGCSGQVAAHESTSVNVEPPEVTLEPPKSRTAGQNNLAMDSPGQTAPSPKDTSGSIPHNTEQQTLTTAASNDITSPSQQSSPASELRPESSAQGKSSTSSGSNQGSSFAPGAQALSTTTAPSFSCFAGPTQQNPGQMNGIAPSGGITTLDQWSNQHGGNVQRAPPACNEDIQMSDEDEDEDKDVQMSDEDQDEDVEMT